jgi:Arc/MetJ-type ribon-helix-helix transcriptional regulator
MNVPLTSELKRWVEQVIETGQFPSEEAVMVAALKAMKGQETSTALEDLIDLDFEAFCAREGDDAISLEEVREATSKIPGSMAEAIIEDERAERF